MAPKKTEPRAWGAAKILSFNIFIPTPVIFHEISFKAETKYIGSQIAISSSHNQLIDYIVFSPNVTISESYVHSSNSFYHEIR